MKKILLFVTCMTLIMSCVSVKEHTNNNALSEKKKVSIDYEDIVSCQSVAVIIQAAPSYKLPYFRPKKQKQPTMGIAIAGDTIPKKVYSNVQCTEFVYPDNYEGMPKVITKIIIPGTPYILLNTRISSGELSTEELLLTDKSGKIYDILIGKVITTRGTVVKQFYVKKDGEITVISIEPEDKNMVLPLKEAFQDFYGYKVCCIYKAEKGEFVLKKEIRYEREMYSYDKLTDILYDLWNGTENPLI